MTEVLSLMDNLPFPAYRVLPRSRECTHQEASRILLLQGASRAGHVALQPAQAQARTEGGTVESTVGRSPVLWE